MALIHPKSCESVHSGLDLFSVPPTQTAVEEGSFVEYYPLSAISSGAPIEFSINGATEDYLDLSNTFLHVRAKVTEADGSDLADGKDVAPINYWLHSLFSQVDISLNDTLITSSDNTYPYRAYLEATLNFGSDAKRGHLTAALYYRDSANHLDDTQGDANAGLKIRRDMSAKSKEIDMMGRLHADIMHQERYMLPGVDVKIRLIPSKAAFNLIAHNEDGGYRSTITHASLFVRKAKLNPAVSLAHEKALEKGTAKYPMKRVVQKTFSIPGGQLSHVQDNLFLSQSPTRIIIGLVDTAAFNGKLKANPFNFKTHNLSFVCLYMDGRQVPAKQLMPDFENQHHVRAYHGLMTATGHTGRDSGNYIEYRDFALGYTLYAFDLSPSLVDGDQFELVKSGALRLELKFSDPLANPVHVIVFGELDSMIGIDRSRQVLTDFSA
ncbi:uncharacterized protein F54H12.2-like [Pomacea canaliculata]|uniref:uncharacterized protein F54H12.2-like n=1 Tax=Pomacea canaliculata TaxID=400727 RepID=UPI000D729B3A|nr:uncharacterized protein F54H12.2-like [Pomacea canaliculata]